MSVEILPCPRCCSTVEYTNSRDLDILTWYIKCEKCGLITFQVDTMAFIKLNSLDKESTIMKYNQWVKTNPKSYYDEKW